MRITTMGALVLLIAIGCQSGSDVRAEPEKNDKDAAIPKNASVTVYPVGMLGRPNTQVAKVVAMFLERGGMTSIEMGEAAFRPDAKADFEQQAAAFGAFAAQQKLETDYALYGEYLGTPKSGVAEVRSVLVDKSGRVVWSDRQKPGDAAFDREKPRNPMSCTVLMVKRLEAPLHLDDPFRKDAPTGRHHEQIRKDSGIPGRAEMQAMQQRAESFRKRAVDAKVVVCPARVGDTYSVDAARRVAAGLSDGKLAKASVSDRELRFTFTPNMNQQKVLWSAARSIQAALRDQPIDADYIVDAHYAMAKTRPQPFGVHTFVLDRSGELVVVDYQNSHHADFRRLKPTTPEQRAALTVARLSAYLG